MGSSSLLPSHLPLMNRVAAGRNSDSSPNVGVRRTRRMSTPSSSLSGGLGVASTDGVIIVDHGSRRRESNAMLNEFVAMFKDKTGYPIVEPAHMVYFYSFPERRWVVSGRASGRQNIVICNRVDPGLGFMCFAYQELAMPTIKDAFTSCVRQGAIRIIVSPFFLFPGRHWYQDIPSLAAEAAEGHSGISYFVTAPLGLHELMVDVMNDRIVHCLRHVEGGAEECQVCAGTGKCRLRG